MTQGANVPGRRRKLALFIATPLLAVVALMAWGLSSAVGATPDEDFHLTSIWCGHGDNENGCTAAADPDQRIVNRDLVVDSICFAFNKDASAECHGTDFGQNPSDVIVTGRGNFEALYPPVFYFTMSLFAGADIESSVLVMKLVNSLLFVGLVSVLFWLLPPHRRPTLVWSLAISIVPLGIFLIASTNPSSWAILSAGTLWLALLGYFESSGRRRVGLAAVAAVSTFMGAGARADAALYSGLAIVIVLFLTFKNERRYWLSAILPAALLVVAGLFYLSASQVSAVSTGLSPEEHVAGINPIVLAAANLINVPSLWAGALGSGNLGWLDTVMPGSVGVAVLGCFCGAVFLGLGARYRRKGIALLAVLVVLFALPTILLVQSQALVGAYFQPRYILPLLVLLAGLVLLYRADAPIVVNRIQVGVAVAAISLANAVALHTNIRRYVTGADDGRINLDVDTEWWWHLPVSPMTVWIVGSLAFAGVLVAIASRTWNAAPVAPVPDRPHQPSGRLSPTPLTR